VRRPAGELGIQETAERLGLTPARLRRQVIEQRWDEVPPPADQQGLDLRWREADVERFRETCNTRLRIVDIAARLGHYPQHVRKLIAEKRFDTVPPPPGRDHIGYWWSRELVDAWIAERANRLNAKQAAEMIGVSYDTFKNRLHRGAWHLVPPPAGDVRGRRYWLREQIALWQARQ
jgi:hypothetical protein